MFRSIIPARRVASPVLRSSADPALNRPESRSSRFTPTMRVAAALAAVTAAAGALFPTQEADAAKRATTKRKAPVMTTVKPQQKLPAGQDSCNFSLVDSRLSSGSGEITSTCKNGGALVIKFTSGQVGKQTAWTTGFEAFKAGDPVRQIDKAPLYFTLGCPRSDGQTGLINGNQIPLLDLSLYAETERQDFKEYLTNTPDKCWPTYNQLGATITRVAELSEPKFQPSDPLITLFYTSGAVLQADYQPAATLAA